MAPIVSAVIFASLLTGTVLGLWDASAPIRMIGPIVALVAAGTGVLALRSRNERLYLAVLALAACLMGLLALHLSRGPVPVPMRAVQLAAVVCWGPIVLAIVLGVLRIAAGRALWLGFAIVIPLLIVDARLPSPPIPLQPRWEVKVIPDPKVGVRYAPNSTARSFYPDNPRGYFDNTNLTQATWSLELHGGNEAHLDHQAQKGAADVLHVTFSKLVGNDAWQVKLQQAPFQIDAGSHYLVSFRARADASRPPIGCAVGNNHAPWKALGGYREFAVTTEWAKFDYPFVASAGDSNARLFLDLAKSDVPIEIADVTVRDQTRNTDVKPQTRSDEYFVGYRFNSLGFRGPDYVIPAPAGTFRIVALGDAYALGAGVKEADTFEAQLANRLNAAPSPASGRTNYDVINAGVSGYGTRDERLSYEASSSKYDPQLVLLMMAVDDDLSYQDEKNAGLVASTSMTNGLSRIADRLATLRQPKREYRYGRAFQELIELNGLCHRRGQKMAVVIFRHNASFAPWLKLVADANRELEGTGIPVLDLGVALLSQGRTEADLTVNAIDSRPNEVAHRLAAQEIETFLRNAGLLPK